MKRNKYLNDLNSIQNMFGQIRTINEAIQFGEDFDEDSYVEDDEDEISEPKDDDECIDGNCDLSKIKKAEPIEDEMDDEVDQIREIALKGMIKLCKTPEDDKYQALKKIFQFCDKAVEPKEKEF